MTLRKPIALAWIQNNDDKIICKYDVGCYVELIYCYNWIVSM